MLACGANVNAQNDRGMTAAHMMLKKGSDYGPFELLARCGARFDLPNKNGVTAAEIMSRKRDPKFRALTSNTGKKRRGMN
jgi:hypothetical protein